MSEDKRTKHSLLGYVLHTTPMLAYLMHNIKNGLRPIDTAIDFVPAKALQIQQENSSVQAFSRLR